jgi:membrane protein
MFQSLRDFLKLVAGRFVATRCPEVAGSLTYTTLLAIVPLVTVTIALFSNFPAFAQLGTALGDFLQTNVLPDLAGQIVSTYALQFSEKAAQLTLIGTAMLVITVVLLLSTIDGVFNDIWGVKQPRPLLTRLAVYWVALTLGPMALAGSIFATGQLVATSIALVGDSRHIGTFTATVMPLTLLGALFSFLYFAVPNHPVRVLHALAGGFAAALAFLVMQRMFGMFIALSPSYTLVYGTFAALPIFLLWLYLSWVVVLLGAIVAATFPDFFERTKTPLSFPGDRACAALSMLVALTVGQREGRTCPFNLLHELGGITNDQTEALLGEMHECGWVARTDDENWILSTHPDQLSLVDVIERFALAPDNWAFAGGGQATVAAARRLHAALLTADLTLTELAAQPAGEQGQIG